MIVIIIVLVLNSLMMNEGVKYLLELRGVIYGSLLRQRQRGKLISSIAKKCWKVDLCTSESPSFRLGPLDSFIWNIRFVLLEDILVFPPLHVILGHSKVEIVPRKSAIL